MRTKTQFFRIKAQVRALLNMLEALDVVTWDDETPMGFEFFLKGIYKQLCELSKSLFLPSGAFMRQKKRRRNRQGQRVDHEEK